MDTRCAPPASRPLRATALVAALTALLLALSAGPAAAHGDEGQMTVVSATESAPMTISVEVGLVHADDQHLAEEAEVWVNASSADTQLEPVALTRSGEGSAVYAGQIPVPSAGEWTLSFESTDPVASAQASVTVADAAPESTTSSTAAPTTAPSTTALGDTDTEEAAATAEEDEDDGLSAVVIALGVVGILVLVAAGVAVAQRRRDDT
jgi:hypothetical protein